MPVGKLYEKNKNIFYILKVTVLKKGVRSAVGIGSGSGYISQMYGSGDFYPENAYRGPHVIFRKYP